MMFLWSKLGDLFSLLVAWVEITTREFALEIQLF